MNKMLITGLLTVLAAASLPGATAPFYFNRAPVQVPPDSLPPIDARAFVNSSLFSISSFNGLPYETDNTLFYTNETSGQFIGSPGFRFQLKQGSFYYPSSTFFSQGSISASTYLLINATNIIISGPVDTDATGLIRLTGRNVILNRNGLRSGLASGTYFGGGRTYGSNYFNAIGVSDLYWGVGTNNMINGGPAMNLNAFPPNFNLPFPLSPYHQVIRVFFGQRYTNLVVVPSFSSFNFGAFAHTNRLGPNEYVIQTVFVATNNFDTNFSTAVRFYDDFDSGATALVEFQARDYDITRDDYNTNFVYLIDSSAFPTNLFLARPYFGNTFRPNTIELTRSTPFEWTLGETNNAVFTNGMLDRGYVLTSVTNRYAAYAAEITTAALSNAVAGGGIVTDPTNFPGRVEIYGDNVTLDQTRVRAESTAIFRIKNLSSNRVARVDAPYAIFDLGTTQPQLVISNLAPSDVHRLSGQVACWSGTWDNYLVDTNGATNTIHFHVLVVDNSLRTAQPVSLWEFSARATNLVIQDSLFVDNKMLLDAVSLDLRGGLSLPFGSSWGATNVLRLIHFTNHGVLNIPGSGSYGTDRPNRYAEFINYGTNSAAAQFIRATQFVNTGILRASGGLMAVDSLTALLAGAPTLLSTNVFTNYVILNGQFVTNVFTNIITNSIGALMEGNSDIEIRARDLSVSNSVLAAGVLSPGALNLYVTNSLMDAGPSAINDWRASGGFGIWRRPTNSSLLGTWLRTTVPRNMLVDHYWSALNRGPTVAGFSNNLALGKLVMDAGNNSLLRFFGAQTNAALYVDYIEFANFATNYSDPNIIAVDPAFTIYFANANVPAEKLDGIGGGRFRWVSSFTGPLSSTNITYSSGRTYTFNIALVTSKDLDSDGDGIVNADDPEPIYVGDSTRLTIRWTTPPQPILLSWNALARSTNFVEYKSLLQGTNWLVLTNLVAGPVSEILTARDSVSSPQRWYRLRVIPPPP